MKLVNMRESSTVTNCPGSHILDVVADSCDVLVGDHLGSVAMNVVSATKLVMLFCVTRLAA